LTTNIIELVLEMGLYAWLIHVSFVLSSFLKSFDEKLGQETPTRHYQMVKQGRCIFIIVSINIAFMMITNSVFSALSSYLWLGDVWSKNATLVKLYSASATLFYTANTFFACLVLWVLHHFGINSKRNGLATIVNQQPGEGDTAGNDESMSLATANNKRLRSRYLMLDTGLGNGSLLDMSTGTVLLNQNRMPSSDDAESMEGFDYYKTVGRLGGGGVEGQELNKQGQ